MGRDFSIGCSDSTCKGISHIMFDMVRIVSQIADDVDNIPNKYKYISTEQLARIIRTLKNDLAAVQYDSDLKVKFVEGYRFYTNDTFEKVYENCKLACDLFVNALVDAILNEEDKIYWNYL